MCACVYCHGMYMSIYMLLRILGALWYFFIFFMVSDIPTIFSFVHSQKRLTTWFVRLPVMRFAMPWIVCQWANINQLNTTEPLTKQLKEPTRKWTHRTLIELNSNPSSNLERPRQPFQVTSKLRNAGPEAGRPRPWKCQGLQLVTPFLQLYRFKTCQNLFLI